jgi:N-acetyl-D-muramate 6-phosphate phosphatase
LTVAATAKARAGVRAVLFDLDGTLVDSAPDLTGTLNDMRAERGLAPWPVAELREHCGSGARGMLTCGLQVKVTDPGYVDLRDNFLARYEARMLRHTAVFEHVVPLLQALDAHGMPWGIVTNKARRFSQPICTALRLLPRAAVLVSGDTTPHAKPHPAPLLEAARQLDKPASACVYVGDDARDITAGGAAGMGTLAALWGYVGAGQPPAVWGADALLAQPQDLLHWLELA